MKILTLFVCLAATGISPVSDTVSTGVDLSGRILLEGDRPRLEPLDIAAKSSEGCCPPGETVDATNRTLLLSKDGGIANVVVTVEVKGAEVRVPDEPLVLDNRRCRFEPHVLVVPVGATVEFSNSDETTHNVHTFALKSSSINETIAAGTRTRMVAKRAERIRVACDIHSWMKGWIYVTDTPFHALTDASGAFSIEGLPPGEHEATLWHERLGKKKITFSIDAEGKTRVDWRMSQQKKGKQKRRR